MEDVYKFSFHRLETYDEDLHPYILGILKWQISEYITPPTLRYFKKPEQSDYPLILESENYKHRCLTLNIEILPIFLSNVNVRAELKLRQLKKISIWSNRGAIARILMGAFYKRNWRMFAKKIGSKIYLTSERDGRQSKSSMQHWKFVQNCFADSVDAKPNTNLPIDEDEQFYCLFHAEIGDFDLFYTGEVTGVIAKSDVKNMYDLNELNELKFVLTKTVFDHKSPSSWLHKFQMLWTQSYLAKVNHFIVAIKEGDKGRPVSVRKDILDFQTDQLCQIAKLKKERQLGELNGFLKWLETKMSDINCPYTTCELNFNSDSKEATFKIHEGKTEHSFLSPELIEYFKGN